MSVKLHTTHGDLIVTLHYTLAPLACRNFLELCKAGYYDGQHVYQFVTGRYMVAGAPDPQKGNFGRSIYGKNGFKSEMTAKLAHKNPGMVGCWVTENRLNANGSEFYVTLGAQEEFDGRLAIFGEVENLSILAEMTNLVKVGKNNIPVQPFKIFSAVIIEDPWAGQALPAGVDIPDKVLVKTGNGNCELM
jgi:cyclophilin family peptidyl-prolyl cis-trans isomerase